MTQINIKIGDITEEEVDAIVNAANKSLLSGGGVDGAIHHQAGPKLLEKCKTLGGCKTGEAKITKGYNLPTKYIIHTVGPVWLGGNRNEAEDIKSCYLNSLIVAKDNNIKTISFPAISTGIYRFPKDLAAQIAINTINEYVNVNPNTFSEINFVLYSNDQYKIYKKIIK